MIKNVLLPSGNLSLTIHQSEIPIDELCCFATRANNKRGFLFVSKVLGKHYPVKPSIMNKVYENLSHKLTSLTSLSNNICFIGFAETAIGLGGGTFHSWREKNPSKNALFMPTSRFKIDNEILFEFKEEHSHATDHLIYQPKSKENQDIFKSCDTLVLIDDEISTGKTLFNFIEQYKKVNSSVKNVFLVSITNWINDDNKSKILNEFPELRIEFVSILEGNFVFEKNENFFVPNVPKLDGKNELKDYLFNSDAHLFRLGINQFNYSFDETIKSLDLSKKTLVLGSNEFLIKPYFLAKEMENKGCNVYFQSTTRSPIIVDVDIHYKNTSFDNYNDNIENYVYNVNPNDYEQIIICLETKSPFGLDIVNQLNAKIIYM